MQEYNEVEVPITPEMPITVPDEVRFVYIPKATLDNAGIVLPDAAYFSFKKGGRLDAEPLKIDILLEVDGKLVEAKKEVYDELSEVNNELSSYIEHVEGALIMGLNDKYSVYYSVPQTLPDRFDRRYYYPVSRFERNYNGDIEGNTGWIEGTSLSEPYTSVIRDKYGRIEAEEPPNEYESSKYLVNVAYLDKRLESYSILLIVSQLPEIGLSNKIYLVPKSNNQNGDLFDEYIWVNNDWEWITTKQLEIDLTPYATVEFVNSKADVDEMELDTMLKEVLV
jgi:hypothetical protein